MSPLTETVLAIALIIIVVGIIYIASVLQNMYDNSTNTNSILGGIYYNLHRVEHTIVRGLKKLKPKTG